MSVVDPEEFIHGCQQRGMTAEQAAVAWHEYLQANYDALKPVFEEQDRRDAEHRRKCEIERAAEAELERITHWVEIHREEWDDEYSKKLTCPSCGRAITLHYNGGELDGHSCGDYRIYLQHVRIDYVIEQRQPREGA